MGISRMHVIEGKITKRKDESMLMIKFYVQKSILWGKSICCLRKKNASRKLVCLSDPNTWNEAEKKVNKKKKC